MSAPPAVVDKALYLPRRVGARTLADFGYAYTPQGTLRHIATGTPYVFLSQKHYDVVGNAVTDEIYQMMEDTATFAMRRVQLPMDATPEEATAPIFVSHNANVCDTALLICQGSGAVRPGMWARALCMNDSLDRGTVFPYLQDAKRRGWGTIVLNPNENTAQRHTTTAGGCGGEKPTTPCEAHTESQEELLQAWVNVSKEAWGATCRERRNTEMLVRGSESPEDHMISVYQDVIPVLFPKLKRLFIVAHSYGGKCVTALLREVLLPAPRQRERTDDALVAGRLQSLVPAIALTDAINDVRRNDRRVVKAVMRERSVNWVASNRPLDSMMPASSEGCLELSAGHIDHVHTSESCRTSVFALFDFVSTQLGSDGTNEVIGLAPQYVKNAAAVAAAATKAHAEQQTALHE